MTYSGNFCHRQMLKNIVELSHHHQQTMTRNNPPPPHISFPGMLT
uniref:Uncharacterized protein n=1 Tax=Klebsiella pneumoniae TaxID=573 RepID=A0A8B0SXS7_KLEPN|nr:hypothetical protein [Klebsiella pneumoniae]